MPVTGRRDRAAIAHERLTRTRNGWFWGGLHKLSSAGRFSAKRCNLRRLHSNRHGSLKVCMSVVTRREYRPNGTAFPSFTADMGRTRNGAQTKKSGRKGKRKVRRTISAFFGEETARSRAEERSCEPNQIGASKTAFL